MPTSQVYTASLFRAEETGKLFRCFSAMLLPVYQTPRSKHPEWILSVSFTTSSISDTFRYYETTATPGLRPGYRSLLRHGVLTFWLRSWSTLAQFKQRTVCDSGLELLPKTLPHSIHSAVQCLWVSSISDHICNVEAQCVFCEADTELSNVCTNLKLHIVNLGTDDASGLRCQPMSWRIENIQVSKHHIH